MARLAKTVENTSSHLTKEEIERRNFAEDKIKDLGAEKLKDINSSLFYDGLAEETYHSTLEELVKFSPISNLDYPSLLNYSNTFSMLVQVMENLRQRGDTITIDNNGNEKSSQYFNQYLKLVDNLRLQSNALGIDVSSRISLAQKIVDREQEQIQDEFGDI